MNGRDKINQLITQRMIDRITEIGELPWHKPWTSVSMMPRNLVSKKNYRGVNVFLLHMMGFTSQWWLTLKQVNALGGKIRTGEKGSPVVFFKIVEPRGDAVGSDGKSKSFAMLRYYRVWNTDQCEGLDGKVPVVEVPKRVHTPIENAEAVIRNMPCPPRVAHGRRQASYCPPTDTVSMPSPETFVSGESYFSALLHECVHATGAAKRLARKAIMEPNRFGSDPYAKEELVAELGAAFLCGHCGILPKTEENSAAYLKGWLARLKAEPSMLITAGSQAQKAYDYVLGNLEIKAPAAEPVAEGVVAEKLAA
ncbi:DNA primase TraC [Pontiella desulfatans]|uniref:DNA primase TraC n=1 Tax=Pontiella desulfatans TaxID=2750659 RepID=A0A6C2UC73_PONDE|nr:zincin-like metallopeptidase domain-containing protein [Pontiella desulfatans]VGO17710.1 DNA primase TraC [Pontiella desulfatans]